MSDLLVLPMQERHLGALAQLEQLCFSRPWSKNALKEELTNPVACFLAAELYGKVAGYAGMHCAAGECYVDNIAVFPEFRRKGVASALIDELIRQARKRNGEFISLEVRESNETAISLYQKIKFERVGVRKGFYQAPTENALILTRFLI